MKNKFSTIILIAFCSLLVIRCNSKNDLVSDHISDYTNLGVGKYVIYKLDSTITLPFGTGFTVNSYTVKDSIEALITDNLNRPAFRIVRYVWDEPTHVWNNSNTFMAVQTANKFEYIENNMRQVRLVSPIVDNFSWNGNSAIGVSPFHFGTNDAEYLDWSFSYSNVGMPFKVGNLNFDTTITVVQYDSTVNKPFSVNNLNNYSSSYEVYAKGVGKIFQDLFSWEYQTSYITRNCLLIHCLNNKCDTTQIKCNTDGTTDGSNKNCDSIARAQLDAGVRIVCDTVPGNYYYSGYGVKLSILNHN
ncbi:MAG TPA: hypothetical protein VK645_14105 [Chitinophagaceae bacterium]|nr:hypothetical protein [Chitinophagaceae bacterium]